MPGPYVGICIEPGRHPEHRAEDNGLMLQLQRVSERGLKAVIILSFPTAYLVKVTGEPQQAFDVARTHIGCVN